MEQETAMELSRLRQKVSELAAENAVLLNLVGGTTPTTSTAAPTVIVQGMKMKASMYEMGVLGGVGCVVMLLWALPFLKPFKRSCESRIYKIFPMITLLNLLIIGITLNVVHAIKFNDLFFMFVKLVEVLINSTQKALVAFLAFFMLVLLWKFKDRILAAIGVDNPQMVIGEFRDWATLWSMKRFYPIEVFIWKVEDLPAMHLHQMNDVFVEMCCGYNNVMRTRVHHRGGHTCLLKESFQLNFDHYDKDTRLYVNIKNQDVMGASDIAAIQLGADQIQRFLKDKGGLDATKRTLGWGTSRGGGESAIWAPENFHEIYLIPAGKIYLGFKSVRDDDEMTRGGSARYGHGELGATC